MKLIRVTHLPARHSKLVRVSVDCPSRLNSLCIFEQELCHLHKTGVTMSDGLVDIGEYITLIIRNQGAEPVLLEEGDIIGYLQSAKLSGMFYCETKLCPKVPQCHTIQSNQG